MAEQLTHTCYVLYYISKDAIYLCGYLFIAINPMRMASCLLNSVPNQQCPQQRFTRDRFSTSFLNG